MPDIVIAFFALGLLAGLVKSDLKVPPAIYETLSILLMLTLGLKGGMALHGHTQHLVITELVAHICRCYRHGGKIRDDIKTGNHLIFGVTRTPSDCGYALVTPIFKR